VRHAYRDARWSSLKVFLPRAEVPVREPEREWAAAELDESRVLVIDDDKAVLKSILRMSISWDMQEYGPGVAVKRFA
jgi:hypothetical protein